MDKKLICMAPFTEIEINEEGDVNCCCMQYTNKYVFGNIYKQSFDKIWNGEKAKEFRKDIIEGKYTYCNTKICNFGRIKSDKPRSKLTAFYPKYVTIAYDKTCNLMCVTCRDKIIRDNSMSKKQINENIEKYYLDICKNAKEVTINPLGECLASKHSRALIKKIAEKYPKIQFNILTNGILCNGYNLRELGLYKRLATVQVSIHAATKETYNRITRVGNFDAVMKNLKWLAKEQEKKHIYCVVVNFVVSSLNYKEMPAFVKMAKELYLTPCFWEFQNWHTTKMHANFKKYTVWDSRHPEYKKFLEVLKDPIFDYELCQLNTLFTNLRQKALSKK